MTIDESLSLDLLLYKSRLAVFISLPVTNVGLYYFDVFLVVFVGAMMDCVYVFFLCVFVRGSVRCVICPLRTFRNKLSSSILKQCVWSISLFMIMSYI